MKKKLIIGAAVVVIGLLVVWVVLKLRAYAGGGISAVYSGSTPRSGGFTDRSGPGHFGAVAIQELAANTGPGHF